MKMDHASFTCDAVRHAEEPRGLTRAARLLGIGVAGFLSGVALAQALISSLALLAGLVG
ncbi:hypothetical protein [Sphingomicrobium sediminis]|uniref:Uncharacterized protein n=1 Tax=Sphingomicrobium sediminis TaxID=2950949 RepID=A0A9X2J2P6_9SPHN|nr:hypothetical protein [Sphingomicrobium sediminis]MCM8557245.1 hypothetical protein [Sphingomicrobium sediminis]